MSIQRIIPGHTADPIHHIRAGDLVVASCTRKVEAASEQLAVAQRCPIGKAERLNRMRAQCVIRIKGRQMNCVAGRADTNQQRVDAESQIGGRDACTKLNRITVTCDSRVGDRIDPIAGIEEIGVVARAARQLIVTESSSDRIVPRARIHDIVAGQRIDDIVAQTDRDRIVAIRRHRAGET